MTFEENIKKQNCGIDSLTLSSGVRIKNWVKGDIGAAGGKVPCGLSLIGNIYLASNFRWIRLFGHEKASK